MKLHEVDNNTWVRLISDAETPIGCPIINAGMIVKFIKPDGMFSVCLTLGGNILHPAMFSEVEVVDTENGSNLPLTVLY